MSHGPTPVASLKPELARPACVLLFETADARRQSLGGQLARQGYQVLTARDRREAVGVYQAHVVDLLLVNESQPGLGGAVAFELLTALKPALPVIVVTPAPAHRVLNQRLSIRLLLERTGRMPVMLGVLRLLLQNQQTTLVPPRKRHPRSSRPHAAETSSVETP